jgi:hypothetical protein
MLRYLFFWMSIAAVLPAAVDRAPQKQSIYIKLFVRLNDHINVQLTEDRVRRSGALVAELKEKYGLLSPSVSMNVTGAVAQAFHDRRNAVKVLSEMERWSKLGIVEIGYDGSDEPTPSKRPQPNFRWADTPEKRWLARLEAYEWFLNEFKNPLNGDPDPRKPGGLKKTLEVFGNVTSVYGIAPEAGVQPELTHLLRRMKVQAVLHGLPEVTAAPLKDMVGAAGALAEMGKVFGQGSIPEVYWYDNMLRLSDAGSPSMRILSTHEGLAAVRKYLEGLDRTKPHVVRLEIASALMYLLPGSEKGPLANTVRYGYDNPKRPVIEPNMYRPDADVNAAYASEREVLEWLAASFLPANPGSRFIAPSELLRAAKVSVSVPKSMLDAAAQDLLSQWQEIGNHPPSFAKSGEEWFSLADMFQMLAAALGHYARNHVFPGAVERLPVYGPIEITLDQGPAQISVSRSSIMNAADAVYSRLANQDWTPIPTNIIPGWITVQGTRFNAAQFLRAMTQIYVNAEKSDMIVPTCQMYGEVHLSYPPVRSHTNMGSIWTSKPAVFSGLGAQPNALSQTRPLVSDSCETCVRR